MPPTRVLHRHTETLVILHDEEWDIEPTGDVRYARTCQLMPFSMGNHWMVPRIRRLSFQENYANELFAPELAPGVWERQFTLHDAPGGDKQTLLWSNSYHITWTENDPTTSSPVTTVWKRATNEACDILLAQPMIWVTLFSWDSSLKAEATPQVPDGTIMLTLFFEWVKVSNVAMIGLRKGNQEYLDEFVEATFPIPPP